MDEIEGCGTLQSNFKDESSSSAGNIIGWDWEIGEVKSTVQNPGRVFTDVGTYTICLSVTDDKGNTDKLCKENLISVYGQPIVEFSFDAVVGCSPLLVNFEDHSNSNYGEIVEWVWGLGGDIGIFTSNDGSLPIFTTYEEDGFQTVTLKVIDDKGCEQSLTKQNIIQVEEKPEIIVSSLDAIGCKFPMTVDFENYGADENVIYEWDFGNGKTFVGFNPDPIVYSSQGNYDVTIKSRFVGSDCTDEIILFDYISAGGSILYDFSPKQGCRGLEVQFEDQSSKDAVFWEWDFGDGMKSSDRDPVHTYQNAGTYNISLFRRTDECEGGRVSEYQVIISDNPVINGVIDNTASCLLPAQVNLQAIGANDLNYTWFIGDPGNYIAEENGKNVSVEFTDYGIYRLALVASNPTGCSSVKLFDSLRIEPLILDIEGELEGCIPFTANVNLTSNSVNPLTSIAWQIDGPESFTENKASFGFDILSEGTYNVSVFAENNLGCKDTIHRVGIIKGGPSPVVDFMVSKTDVCPMEGVQFTSNASGDIDYWEWTIGDTLQFETENFSTQIDLPGVYDVKLTAVSNGCVVSKTVENYIKVNPPGTNFTIEYNCDNPNSILAINTSVGADSIVWKYGIGADSTEIINQDSIRINYPDNSIHLIKLTGYNNDSGCSNIYSEKVEFRKPKADFKVDKLSGCSPLEIEFTDASVDAVEWQYFTEAGAFLSPDSPDSKLRIKFGGLFENIGLIVRDENGCADTTYSAPIQVNGLVAKFGSPEPVCSDDTLSILNFSASTFGTIVNYTWVLGENLAVSNEINANFTVSETGKHDLKLIVEDDFGCIDSSFLGLGAFFRTPNFELIADTLACTTSEVSFRNGLHAPGYKYLWEFGDGSTSDLVNPTHLYDSEGDFLVNVSIEDNQKCVNEMDITEVIKVYNPLASFSVDSTFAACPPLISNFTNASVNAEEYIWDYGDKSGFGSVTDPSHLYTYSGFFDVQLVAIRSEQCTDTFRIEDLIQLNGPNGEITFEVDSSCVPLNVSFAANLEEEYRMTWDFGDGILENVPTPSNFATTSHNYLDAGNYIPKIILTNDENCTIVRSGENIQSHDLIASFSLTDSVFCDAIPGFVNITSESISSSPILEYSWFVNEETMLFSNQSIASYSALDLGFYDFKLLVKSEYCLDSIKIDSILRIGNSPIIDNLLDTFTCLGSPINLSYNGAEVSEEYVWYNDSGSIISGADLTPLFDQYYILEVENEYLCSSSDSILVQVIDDKTRFAGPDKTICEGSETVINLAFGKSILWPDDLDCPDCREQLLSPLSKSSYEIIAINEFACTVVDTLVVDVLNKEDIDAGEDQKICVTETAVLLGYAPRNFMWSPSANLSHPSDQITAVRISESTLFTLSSTVDECTLTDSVLIEIIEKAELETRGDTICFGEIAQLYAGGRVDHVRWAEDPTLSSLDLSNPFSSTSESRTFSVIGELGGCESDTAEVMVLVNSGISAELPERVSYFKGSTEVDLSIHRLGNGNYQIMWKPEEVVNCNSCEQVKIAVDGNPIEVEVSILDLDSGCELSRIVEIRQFENCEGAEVFIGVPNIFSPNDDGFNDLLIIEAPAFPEIKEVNIFDRWGQRVFRANGLGDSWDGMVNGVKGQNGVYTYSITALCPEDGSLIVKRGDVTVVR